MDMAKAPMEGAEKSPEDSLIDQIGELMAQLSPEKQAQVLEKLSEMMGGEAEDEMQMENVSMEGGTRGKPVGY